MSPRLPIAYVEISALANIFPGCTAKNETVFAATAEVLVKPQYRAPCKYVKRKVFSSTRYSEYHLKIQVLLNEQNRIVHQQNIFQYFESVKFFLFLIT